MWYCTAMEAQNAESKVDFIHKMKIALKELRESSICLKIMDSRQYSADNKNLVKAIEECNELISIFVKSIETATRNLNLARK